MKSARDVSVVVVNFNGAGHVEECFRALCAQDVPLAEVILVDNGSNDGSPDTIRGEFPHAQVQELGENFGPAAARNAGLRLARSDLVLLIDNDLYLEPDCVRRLLARYDDDGPKVVIPRIAYHPERNRIQCDGTSPHFSGTMTLLHGGWPLAGAPDDPAPVGGGLSACLLLGRLFALEVGGFDEDYFFYFEDLEFNLRVTSRGHCFVCEPRALAWHDRGTGVPGLSYRGGGSYPSRRFYLTQRNRLMTMFIYYRLRTLAVLLPPLVAAEVALFLLALSRMWISQWFRAWFWQARHARAIWKKRRRVQAARVRRDRDLLKGGPIPLATGFVGSGVIAQAAAMLSSGLDAYWRVARRLVA